MTRHIRQRICTETYTHHISIQDSFQVTLELSSLHEWYLYRCIHYINYIIHTKQWSTYQYTSLKHFILLYMYIE